ncbi:MAG: gamma-glutamyltransferase [Acidimicrobiia bacterium]
MVPRRQSCRLRRLHGGARFGGPASIAVPGAWAAFGAAQQDYGEIDWSAVMAPSVDLARRGTPLGATSALYLGYALESIFDADPTGSRALRRNGRPLQGGERVRVEGLAETLEHLALAGTDAFYRGELAQKLGEDLRARGSHLTPEDLAAFRVNDAPHWRSRSVAGLSPPIRRLPSEERPSRRCSPWRRMEHLDS